MGRPVPFLVVRTQPMSGPAGLFIACVSIVIMNPIADRAADRFHISP